MNKKIDKYYRGEKVKLGKISISFFSNIFVLVIIGSLLSAAFGKELGLLPEQQNLFYLFAVGYFIFRVFFSHIGIYVHSGQVIIQYGFFPIKSFSVEEASIEKIETVSYLEHGTSIKKMYQKGNIIHQEKKYSFTISKYSEQYELYKLLSE